MTESESRKSEVIDIVTDQLRKKDLSSQAVLVMQKATAKILDRIKQSVDAQIKEDSTPIVDDFMSSVTENMSTMTQQWTDGMSNNLSVFPEGTRYIFRDGNATTIIVEQVPQVRHVNISGRTFLLAMPYVQFIVNFKDGAPTGVLHVGCTKKPISDVDQPMYYVPLPNIDENHKVCLGDSNYKRKGSMTEIVNSIIGGFWQSGFTTDGSAKYINFLIDNKYISDAQLHMKGTENWAKASLADVLLGVSKNIKLKPGATFRRFLLMDSNKTDNTQTIGNNLKKEIVKSVSAIGEDIKKLFTSVDFKTENREKVHVETLNSILKEIIVQAYTELWEYSEERFNSERARLQKESADAIQKLKDEIKNKNQIER